MLAKLTAKNQVTLHKAVESCVETNEYFDVTVESGCIVLMPVRIQKANAVRDKLEEIGITGQDVENAIAWARQL
jgi:hypothetical protein